MLFHCGFSQDIEYSPYATEYCCLPILYVTVYVSNPKLPLLPSPTHLSLGNPKSVLYVFESVSGS